MDTNYGTLADFKNLVAAAHARGFKVIMDLVADHTAWDSVMMKHPEFSRRMPGETSCHPSPNGRTWPA